MNVEQMRGVVRRAAVHAALADVTRLQIMDRLALGDAASSELAAELDVPSNLLAHHLKTLKSAGLVRRHRSEGDRRRSYWHSVDPDVRAWDVAPTPAPSRVVFVCTANSARSQLAAALWTRASDIPVTSAGTHPAEMVDPGAVSAAVRHDLPLPADAAPRALAGLRRDEDLVVTVCDLAHEEVDVASALHWSIPDPVRIGTDAAFDDAVDLLSERINALAPRLQLAS